MRLNKICLQACFVQIFPQHSLRCGKTYGYARVSTKEQHEDRQLAALKEFGVMDKELFVDKQSGKDFECPAYLQMLGSLRKGDTLAVKSIDRIGRNYEEIIEQWRLIKKTISVHIVVLDMPLLDNRRENDFPGTFVSDITLQILSFVAHQERDFIRRRQKEGIAQAKARGVHFGRPKKLHQQNYGSIYDEWRKGTLSCKMAAMRLGVSESTFRRRVREQRENEEVGK